MKKLYVGNLPYSYGDADVQKLFQQYGQVVSAKVITDAASGRSKGFAFVEMNDQEATAAREKLNGQDIGGRALKVDEAQPRRDSRDGGGGGGGGDRGRGPGGGGRGPGGGGRPRFQN